MTLQINIISLSPDMGQFYENLPQMTDLTALECRNPDIEVMFHENKCADGSTDSFSQRSSVRVRFADDSYKAYVYYQLTNKLQVPAATPASFPDMQATCDRENPAAVISALEGVWIDPIQEKNHFRMLYDKFQKKSLTEEQKNSKAYDIASVSALAGVWVGDVDGDGNEDVLLKYMSGAYELAAFSRSQD